MLSPDQVAARADRAVAAATAAAGSEEPRDGDASQLADGWRQRIPRQLDALAHAWADPAAWNGETAAGGIPLPAAAAGMFALDEVIAHGWELARSTGQEYSTDETAVTACADFLADQPREGSLFGPVVVVPDDQTLHRPADRPQRPRPRMATPHLNRSAPHRATCGAGPTPWAV